MVKSVLSHPCWQWFRRYLPLLHPQCWCCRDMEMCRVITVPQCTWCTHLHQEVHGAPLTVHRMHWEGLGKERQGCRATTSGPTEHQVVAVLFQVHSTAKVSQKGLAQPWRIARLSSTCVIGEGWGRAHRVNGEGWKCWVLLAGSVYAYNFCYFVTLHLFLDIWI